ncbi:unnamed protein product [Protopolystoma xenopodis]|uniref:Uncharacterized protein n=1 Tax=Protopolystoma xenopodis TaxID=117903 RepID=A0A3S5FGN1_9PLAT|nr:unnamed protein product [Protopolystoma xenopodis]
MTPEAALAKLAYVLAKDEWTDLATRRAMLCRNLCGELTIKGDPTSQITGFCNGPATTSSGLIEHLTNLVMGSIRNKNLLRVRNVASFLILEGEIDFLNHKA